MLGAQELAYIREFATTGYLNDSCGVHRRTTVDSPDSDEESDGRGGIVDAADDDSLDGFDAQEPVGCRVERSVDFTQTGVFSGRLSEIANALVILPHDTVVDDQDKLETTDGVSGEVTLWEVIAVGESTERFTLPCAVREL